MAYWIRTILLTAAPAECGDAASGHLGHLATLRAEGRLRFAGELGSGAGYVDVFEADDRWSAEATAAESPLIAEGLGAWTLRPWQDLDL
jgi:uncharacterized protein YciI